MQRQISSNNQSIKLDSAISMSRAYLNKLHLQTLALALFADIKCFNLILSSFVGNNSEDGFLSFIIVFIIGSFVSSLLIGNNNTKTGISTGQVLIVTFLLLFYLVTNIFIGTPRTSLVMFVSFCIVPLLIPSFIHIDAKLFLKAVMCIPVLGVFNMSKIFILDLYDIEKLSMGVSYAFLTPIIATITYLFLFFKEDSLRWRIVIIIVSLINSLYFISILQYGSRAPVLCIVILVLSFFLYKKQNGIINLRKGRVLPVLIMATIAFISIESVLAIFQNLLDSYGLSFRFIDKSLSLLGENDLSNGRASITRLTVKGILDSPIIGHGFDMFDKNTGLLYPHNFLLQLLYDGGVCLLFLVLIPVIRSISKKIVICPLNAFAVYITLFCSGVIGALFSGNMWAQALLWLFMGVMMSKTKIV